MARPSPSKIASVLLGDEVYGLDLDSRIRQAGNSMSARLLFELLGRLDEDAPDFGEALRVGLEEFSMGDSGVLIGFDDGTFRDSGEPLDDSGQPLDQLPGDVPSMHYLKLVFRSVEAAYYQYPLFPTFEVPGIESCSRKRENEVQHVRLELRDRRFLQRFLESLMANPHFVRVDESQEDEFWKAPSHAI